MTNANMTCTSILKIAMTMAIASHALAFSSQQSPCNSSLRATFRVSSKPRFHYRRTRSYDTRILNSENDNNGVDDDDGWGDEQVVMGAGTTSPAGSLPTTDRISKSRELEMLQNDMAKKQSRQNTANLSQANDSGERDLFIPIVTIVSVIGFTGLYGYEMLRLYSRGELYLPWEN
mmetsp:Transcript_37903/g.79892  ORF Transcript_37903/g.79892 Transcript_37903/m.79892 type:complete len:175 (+) Transcript_37903:212-736(+)